MEKISNHVYVLILAGGGGTRLWPKSRDANPKQFLKLFEGKSLFELTLERALKLTEAKNIFISTNEKYRAEVKKQCGQIPLENIIAEPIRRDTALAHGVGAAYIYRKDPEAIICNFASDHIISPLSVFVKQFNKVIKLAGERNEVVTVGIPPKFPHTGMGHIRARKPVNSDDEEVLWGEKFVEKPPLEIAEKYTESGEYYWNANLYTYKAKLFLDLLKIHAPKTYVLLPKLIEAIGTEKENEILQQTFQMAPSISIDYAVAENLKRFVCIPAKFDWSDVGDWSEMWKQLSKDAQGNVVLGTKSKYINFESENNMIILDKKLIATSNIKNMIIIDTPDALLICSKKDSQSVKKIVELLKEKEMKNFL